MVKPSYTTGLVLIALLAALSLQLHARQLSLPLLSFAPGDLIVSLEPGPVLWYGPDGTLRRPLIHTVTGTGEGMAFDAADNLYVTRWCTDANCQTGNAVEKFSTLGLSQGAVGGTFNCQPHTIAFNLAGSAYIGQGGCAQTIVKTAFGSAWQAEYSVAVENYGVFWLDLGVDDCTIFYTSVGPNVKRFDACRGTQLANLNTEPLPGGMTQDVRALPDGGVLVSSGQVIVRLDQSGAVVRTYEVPGEGALWAGIDIVGDGTFWAANYFSSNVHKFNLATGARLTGFSTGTPANSVVAIRVLK